MTSSIASLDVRQHLAGRTWQPAGHFVAVEGTVYPGAPAPPVPMLNDGTGWWAGFSSGMVGGLANTFDGLFTSSCIGYEASVIPMWPSVLQGRAATVADLTAYAAAYYRQYGTYEGMCIIMSGYSQGSMVVDLVWQYDIFTPPGSTDPSGIPTGTLHYLLPYVYRIYQFGHVFRTPGIAKGNALAGLSETLLVDGVQAGGIGGPLDVTVEQASFLAPDGQPVQHGCFNPGDLYAAAPVGTDPWKSLPAAGKTAYIFYKIIMQPTFTDVIETALTLETPIASIEELFNTMKFFGGGQIPHMSYGPQMLACIGDAINLGLSLPHQL